MFDQRALEIAHICARGLIYLATLLLVGATTFHALVVARATLADDDRTRLNQFALRVGVLAAGLLLIAHGVRLYLQVLDTYQVLVPTRHMIWMLLFRTLGWGKGVMAQLAIAALLFLVLRACSRRGSSRPRTTLAAGLLAALAVPLTGHGIAHGGVLAVVVQALHVWAVSAWLGCLAVLWLASRGGSAQAFLGNAVAAFSPVAMAAAGVLAVSGAAAVFVHVEAPAKFFVSAYGWTLIAKVIAYLGAAGAGFLNWRRVTPRLHTEEGRLLFSRTARIELALAVVALCLTSWLTGLPRPGDMEF